ncbi:MAG: glycosyltransferase [Longimicrobiales bacterium]
MSEPVHERARSAPAAGVDAGSHAAEGRRTATRVRNERVLRPIDFVLFFILSVASLAAIVNFFVTWSINGGFAENPALFLIVTSLLALVLINQQGRWYLLLPMRRPRAMAPEPGLRVAVVTTYVAGAEPRDMLEHSLEALVDLTYPHDTWLLDESDDPDVKALCDRLGVRHFSRLGIEAYQTDSGSFKRASKHGNYNAWLDAKGYHRYDVLAAFDPDHVPHPSFLHGTIGYLSDTRIGYVQAAQAYYNQGASFIAQGAAEETYAYYSAVQMASYGLGYPILVGCHNVHRMRALREIGGFAAHDADDLLLTLHYREGGWEGVYVPRILARGLTPVSWRGYLTQQRRWARSVLDIKVRRREPHSGHLPPGSRIMSFLHGINFMHRSIVGTVAVLILVWMLMLGETHIFRVELLVPTLLLFGTLQVAELYRQRFYIDWPNERGLHWRSALLEYAKWPWLLAALFDVILKRAPAYALTWKTRHEHRFEPFILYHAGLALLTGVAWIIGTLASGEVHPVLRLCAALVIATSTALVATELAGFPAPYDRRLWRPIQNPDRTP